jgi:hypothetical protein
MILDITKKVMFVLLFLVVCSLVSGVTLRTFNDSTSSGNITFTNVQNHSKFLLIPQGATIVNAWLNITGFQNNISGPPTNFSSNNSITTDGFSLTGGETHGQKITVGDTDILLNNITVFSGGSPPTKVYLNENYGNTSGNINVSSFSGTLTANFTPAVRLNATKTYYIMFGSDGAD